MSDPRTIAKAVLAKASAYDQRMPDPDVTVLEAWTEAFSGGGVWMAEALDAVAEHYRQPRPPRIMPGDVIAAIAKMPVTSSRERLASEIGFWAQYPYSRRIQELTGLEWAPTYPTPDGVHGNPDTERIFHRQEFQEWILDNLDRMLEQAPQRAIGGGR